MTTVKSYQSQCDTKNQDPSHTEKLITSSGVKNPSEISRRRFISGAMSMAVISGFGFFGNKLSPLKDSIGNPMDEASSALTIIDTHTHFYDPKRATPEGRDRSVPWPTPNSSLYRQVLPPDWEALAKPLGMSGTVVIEGGTNWLEDNDWILKLAEKHRSVVAFIGNLSGTAILKGTTVPVWDDMKRFRLEVRRLSKNPLFRGIRVGGRSVSDDLNTGHYPHFETLANAGLGIDVLGVPATEVIALAKAVPSLTIVVDHMFNIRGAASPSAKWYSDITALSGPKNIVMKVSGLVEGLDSKQGDAASALELCRGALDHVYKTFGPERLLFGTNWPVSESKGDMSVVTGIIRKYFEPKGEAILAGVFAGNAKKYYKYIDR